MVKVDYTGRFNRMLTGISVTEELSDLINEKILLFQNNPDDSRLRNHPLRRDLEGKWAFSITDDIRIVYEWMNNRTVRFLAIGGHKTVYKK